MLPVTGFLLPVRRDLLFITGNQQPATGNNTKYHTYSISCTVLSSSAPILLLPV